MILIRGYKRLGVGRDSGNQAAAADRNENRIDAVAVLLAQDLHRDGPLPGDHIGIIEGMDEYQVAIAREDPTACS